jgi:aspartyl-tRNA synthetase
MAFANEESVMNITEMAVRHLWQNMIQYDLPSPFPRITYEEAMTFYGSDKPDRRFGMKVSAYTCFRD